MGEAQIFHATLDGARELGETPFRNEKELQSLFEKHLRDLTGIDFVASEHRTGSRHKRRADTLGLDSQQRPVVIEYKLGHGGAAISQGLDYLAWLMDHRGDFRELVRGSLGAERSRKIDFRNAWVLCVAGEFRREDIINADTNTKRIVLLSVYRHGVSTLLLKWVHGEEASPVVDKQHQSEEIDFSILNAKDRELLLADEELLSCFRELVNVIRSVGREVWIEAKSGYWVAKPRKGTFFNLCYFGAHPDKDYVDINITGKDGPLIRVYRQKDLEKVKEPLLRRYAELTRNK